MARIQGDSVVAWLDLYTYYSSLVLSMLIPIGGGRPRTCERSCIWLYIVWRDTRHKGLYTGVCCELRFFRLWLTVGDDCWLRCSYENSLKCSFFTRAYSWKALKVYRDQSNFVLDKIEFLRMCRICCAIWILLSLPRLLYVFQDRVELFALEEGKKNVIWIALHKKRCLRLFATFAVSRIMYTRKKRIYLGHY